MIYKSLFLPMFVADLSTVQFTSALPKVCEQFYILLRITNILATEVLTRYGQ
jgi:hypothetical protein